MATDQGGKADLSGMLSHPAQQVGPMLERNGNRDGIFVALPSLRIFGRHR
jgi:hypothetical protein